MKIGNGYIVTDHAQRRFAERFPELIIAEVWAKAFITRTGKSCIVRIRSQCRNHLDVTRRDFRGYYYKVAERKAGLKAVVFVCAPPKIIVTVFPLENDKDNSNS